MVDTTLYDIVTKYGYYGLVFILFIEGIGIPLPIQLLFIFVAYLISAGKMTFTTAVIVATIGNLLGNVLAYYLGYNGGMFILEKLYKLLRIKKEDIEKLKGWFNKYGGITNMISRWIGITRTPAIWAAGIFRINFFSYMIYSLIGDFVWALVSILLFIRLYSYLGFIYSLPFAYKIGGALIVFLIIILSWLLFFKYFRGHKKV
ncbi:MAG: DedA family protein [Tepidanaerobacteraceae bacterium]|jgi:membrane-associated protein